MCFFFFLASRIGAYRACIDAYREQIGGVSVRIVENCSRIRHADTRSDTPVDTEAFFLLLFFCFMCFFSFLASRIGAYRACIDAYREQIGGVSVRIV